MPLIGRAECDLKMALVYGAPKRHHDRALDIIAMFSSRHYFGWSFTPTSENAWSGR